MCMRGRVCVRVCPCQCVSGRSESRSMYQRVGGCGRIGVHSLAKGGKVEEVHRLVDRFVEPFVSEEYGFHLRGCDVVVAAGKGQHKVEDHLFILR